MGKIKSVLWASILLLVSAQVYADPIVSRDLYQSGDGLITLDKTSGLEYLDLSQTRGLLFDDIVNSNLLDLGFNFATYDQSMEIFRTAGADRAPVNEMSFQGETINSIPTSSEMRIEPDEYLWNLGIDISNFNLLQRLPEMMADYSGGSLSLVFGIYEIGLHGGSGEVPVHDFLIDNFQDFSNVSLLYEGNEYGTRDFDYGYMMVRRAKEPIAIDIDIKPGSDTNCLNTNGHGVIPVAILGSDSFDIANIDQLSLAFGGLDVRIRGKKGPLCNGEYSNGDAYLDLVCHFEDDASAWSPGSEDATLTGTLLDGSAFEGTDSICVVP